MSVMEIFGIILAAASFATLVTWAVCRERQDRRLTKQYRARSEMRAEVIAYHGIQDEVPS